MNRVDFYTPDFKLIDIESLGVETNDFIVDPPSPQHDREPVKGQDGTNTLGTTLDGRTMSASFVITAYDVYDYYLTRNAVYRLFNGLDFMYVVDNREPGKRWSKVKVDTSYDLSRINSVTATFQIPLKSDYAYSESIGTTENSFTDDDSIIWQYGQGLPDEPVAYEQTARDFQYYNAGDITIDPTKYPLVIEVTAAQTSDDIYMSLSNLTTGEDWVYRGPTTEGQVFRIDGVQTLLGGASVSLKTNYGLLKLKPGYNNLSRNSGISKVKFINRFYYF
ncbi:phage tail domain-containing protein [Priestia aryabhattai]|uniref:phage tail domain-containing protein n=1 Tax=Priestia aryabhattai TaxID=412384 RepID=UPI0023B149B2|nr:phage tail domain-containing protein [Priestia aryabhattai]MDE8676450.1 phage tail family protein [Priestia aryabhattai]